MAINSYCSLVGVSGLSRDVFKPQIIGKFSQCSLSKGKITPSVEEILAREISSPCLWASESDQKNFNVFLTLTRKENNLISKQCKGSSESSFEVGVDSPKNIFVLIYIEHLRKIRERRRVLGAQVSQILVALNPFGVFA